MLKSPSFPTNKRVLYCVLNWGLGHASRSMEVIEELVSENNEVTIACDGHPGTLLRQKFPHLVYIELPPYDVRYPTTNIFLNFLANAYKILTASIKERNYINKLHKLKPYDIVISDNRPGCHIAAIPNYYITHQLNPHHQNTFLKYIFTKINNYYLNKYQEIWVPDYDDHRLSGSLSDQSKIKSKVIFLGPLSAYRKVAKEKYRVTILLSGPEPQRSYLEKTLLSVVKKQTSISFTFIRGTASQSSMLSDNCHIEVIDLCPQEDMNTILNETRLLISRTGYSTLMDIDRLGIPQAILIPTPGQTEQEYLGKWHNTRHTIIEEKRLIDQLKQFFSTFE